MEETIEQIRHNAELVVSVAQQMGVSLTYDEQSVKWLEGFIERHRKKLSNEQIERLVDVYGSYLGECIRITYGGHWKERSGRLAVCFDEKNCMYPFAKVEKQFNNGLDDSISGFFRAIPRVFNLGNAKPD